MIHTRWEPRPPATWERWAEAPTATLFQQPRWFRAITRAYSRDRPRFLTAYADGSPVGLIPMVERSRWGIRQWLSLPFGTHGGPLLAPEAPAGTVEALGEAFARRARDPRTLRFEMSLYDPPSVVREGLQPHLGAYFQEFRTHVIDLSPGFDAIWNGAYFRNTRNCVRMAERADVTVAREQGEAAVALLARHHAEQSGGWKGIAPHPLDALRTIVDTLGEDAWIYVARGRDGDPLGASLHLAHAGRELHPWVSGASSAARPVRAFHLLYNTAIRDAADRGFSMFNFGGSGSNEKIEFFKASFGGKPVPTLRIFHQAGWARRLGRGAAWD